MTCVPCASAGDTLVQIGCPVADFDKQSWPCRHANPSSSLSPPAGKKLWPCKKIQPSAWHQRCHVSPGHLSCVHLSDVQEVHRRKEAAVLIATTWKSRRQARYNRLLFRLTLTIKHHMGPAVRRARLRLRQKAASEAMLLPFQYHTQDWGFGLVVLGHACVPYARGQHVSK